jgi:hypothetical protein
MMRPLELGEVMDMGFRLWWRTLKEVLPWTLLFSLPLAALQGYIAYLNSSLTESIQEDTGLFEPSVGNETVDQLESLRVQIGGTGLTLVVTLFGTIILSGALTAYFAERLLNRDTPIKECLKVGFRRVFPLLGTALLVGILMILGCFALCIGFFFVWTVASVASQAVVVERAGPIQALKRSYNLSMPRFWPLLGLLIVSRIVVGAMGIPFGFISSGGSLLAFFGDRQLAGAILQGIAAALSAAVTTPLSAAFLVIVYFDLRVRGEGLDLQLAAQGLGTAR